MDELSDGVMAEIRKHVQAGRQAWEESLRDAEDQRLLDLVFDENGETGPSAGRAK